MKQISGLKYFPHLFTNSTPPQHLPLTALSQCKYKIVFRLVPRRVCRESFHFDRTKFET